jgi:capsular exopolysaccharide synthesis family protein
MSSGTAQFDDLTSEQAGFSYSAVAQMAWRRKSLLALGLAVGLVLGSLHYARQTPIYQSSAQVLVVKKRPDALPSSMTGALYSEDYLSTHVALIRSPLVIERAVAKWELGSLRSLAGMGDPTPSIINGLGVVRETSSVSSSILNLTYRGTAADECGNVLNAVIDSYQEFLQETYQSANEDTLKLITEKAEQIQRELREKGLAYQEFRRTAPVLWNGKDGQSYHQDRLSAIESRRSSLQIRRAELQPRLASLKKGMETGLDREKLLAMVANWAKTDPESRAPELLSANPTESLDAKLFPLLLEEKSLLQEYGKDYPEVQRVRMQIQMTRELHDRVVQRPTGLDKEPKVETKDPVQGCLRSMEQELEDIDTTEQALAALFEQENRAARSLSNHEIEESRFNSEISRAEKFHDSLITQLQGINLGKDFGGYTTRIISAAGDGWRIEPRGLPIFSMAGLLGLVGGLGLAYLLEASDKRFRTPEEIRRRLSLPIVGHVPFLKANREVLERIAAGEARLDPLLVSHYRPNSYEAEAFRGVRTALYFSTHGEEHKVIQITSTNAGDGKTTVAANLAVSIAQSGRRTLLIDADLRKPRVHKVFSISADGGLAAVIAGELELAEAVQESSINGLFILPCGALPSNPAELLTSQRFKELLSLIREEFDFVIIDSPPLLAVTDPCVVAPRVDGVILTISVTKDGRDHAERAREVLGTLEANILGVVVNGTDPEEGYGYKQYGYGQGYRYGRGYGYGYGYGYGEGKANGYLEDASRVNAEDPSSTAEDAAHRNGLDQQRSEHAEQRNGAGGGLLKRISQWW